MLKGERRQDKGLW